MLFSRLVARACLIALAEQVLATFGRACGISRSSVVGSATGECTSCFAATA